jgi:undecaprenyl-diphosphatase
MEQVFTAVVDAVVRVDAAVVDLVLEARGPLATKVLTSATGLGSVTTALVFLGVFYLAGWREEFALAAGTLALTGLVVGVLMATVQRPFPPQPVCLTDGASVATSFPSGHAAAATAFAMVARRSAVLPTAPVAGLAAVVAVSRVYLGTHYFSDTVAGVLIGALAFLLVARLFARRDGVDAV